MSGRRLYLDRAPGETRGVVTLDGRPERLIIAREADPPVQQLGARSVARVRRIEPAAGGAFLEMAGGPDAFLRADLGGLFDGAMIEIEVTAEARLGKGGQVRRTAAAEGPPRLLAAGPDVAERLRRTHDGEIATGPAARLVADEAEDDALATEHALPGGGSLSIEPTRALVAVDVDLGAGRGDMRRAARRANLVAIAETARLLRLKALGGLVAIDLIGAGHDGASLAAAAKAAFAEDGPGVAIGPVSRFGLLQLTLPRRERPIREVLCEANVGLSALTVGLRLLRALERAGEADRGARLVGSAAPAAAQAASAYIHHLTDRMGGRLEIRADPGLDPQQVRVQPA